VIHGAFEVKTLWRYRPTNLFIIIIIIIVITISILTYYFRCRAKKIQQIYPSLLQVIGYHNVESVPHPPQGEICGRLVWDGRTRGLLTAPGVCPPHVRLATASSPAPSIYLPPRRRLPAKVD